MKISSTIASGILMLLATFPVQVTFANTGSINAPLPLTVSPTITKVVENTLSTNTGEMVIAQEEVGSALSKLIGIYERRVTRLQDEISRLRIENSELKVKLGITTNSGTTITSASINTTSQGVSLISQVPKTEQEKKRDIIISNIVSSLPDILSKNNLTASGTIGLFEFIEPKNFFISIDDGLNPPGVTAFKTKILFEYDINLNLKVIGVFELDYGTQKYITRKGNNPFAGATRIRIKNPNYAGKLLEEIIPTTSTTSTSVTTVSTNVTKPLTTTPITGTGSIISSSTTATFADIQKSYDKNKLGDTITLATIYLGTDPNNIEVLTMRARSYYIFSRYAEMLEDISKIYQIQGSAMNCGIINDGARAEKALKGANGNIFTELQKTKCKK